MSRASAVYRLCGSLAGSDLAFPLREGPNQVGSDPLSHVVLREEGVSRRHALVLVEPDRLLVIDEGSKNGTYVNGRRIHRETLALGDAVGFGPVTLRLETVDPDDAELAFVIGGSTRAPAAYGEERSTASLSFPEERAALWLRAVAHVAQRIAERKPDASTRALETMVADLGLRGAFLLDLAVAGDPGLCATAGPIPPALAGAAVRLQRDWRQRGAGSPAEPLTDQGDGLTGWTSPTGLALLLAGGDPAPLPAALVRTLLDVVVLLGRDRPARKPVEAGAEASFPEGLVPGASAAMSSLYRQMRTLAPSPLPVLILGETGVGKEHLAQTIHLWSPRRERPLVPINCAAIPAELLEAELFGIGPRVATGVAGRTGKFMEAEGGTLFLDEVAEMPAELQAKLLRVLQEATLEPLGLPPRRIDVRVVAATNADVDRVLEQGKLRRDLYYRLAGFVLRVPPLRERREDLPPLVEAFVQRFATEHDKPIRGVSVRAMGALMAEDWPGNVRELKSAVERLVWSCPPFQAIDAELVARIVQRPARGSGNAGPAERPRLQFSPPAPQGALQPNPETAVTPFGGGAVRPETLNLEQLEKDAIREAMRKTGWNQVRAARLLGISRYQLRRRLRVYGLLSAEDGFE